eukprot:8657207-Alexandrium_andersonii.AAC.1
MAGAARAAGRLTPRKSPSRGCGSPAVSGQRRPRPPLLGRFLPSAGRVVRGVGGWKRDGGSGG